MIDHKNLIHDVIRPVLVELKQFYGIGDGEAAEELLVLTAAIGSHRDKWLSQDEGAGCTPHIVARSALGIYGMEPVFVKHVVTKVLHLPIPVAPCLHPCLSPDVDIEVSVDLRFATALARLHYHFASERLPALVDRVGRAAYWGTHWNALPEGVHHANELAMIHATQDVAAAVTNYEQYMRTT